ncbi:DUF6063 family protein [Natroniella acetigena]|uniref:DUF6063 family protein n=1 Tax=Natroniella acetigena TaxID=52004 RepID=UPI00200A07E5|nr:DUF6063 family protein [Natroniella acetigena]
MAFNREQLEEGAALFFRLLKEQIIPVSEELAEKYCRDGELRSIVNNIAAQGGLRVFHTPQNIHLVSKARGSDFANSYTQMKEKYSGLQRKRYFYLANIIITIFLAEIDKESYVRVRWEEEGISYYRLADLVTATLKAWQERSQKEDSFTQQWSLAVDEMAELWLTEFSEYKLSQVDDSIDVVRTKNNRLSFINTALRPLVEQELIIDNSDELKVIPRPVLYERLDEIYKDQERYQQFKKLIEESKEKMEEQDA